MTLKTSDAVTLLENLAVECGGTDRFAIAAISTEPGREPPEDAEIAEQTEKRAQRAKVLAPVSSFITFQKENGCEEKEREKSQGVERLPKRKHIVLEKVIASGEIIPIVTQEIVKADPALPKKVAEHRVEEKSEKAYKECDRIQEACQIQPEESSEEKRCEQVIFQVAPEPAPEAQFCVSCL